jgi:type III restriction enzyme
VRQWDDRVASSEPGVHLILETKGFDDLADVKAAAAQRWVAAVNADGQFGQWEYEMARAMPQVRAILDRYLHWPRSPLS